MTWSGDAERALALVAAVARQLNAGGRPVDTLGLLVAILRTELGAGGVALWIHEPNATTFCRISAPEGPFVRVGSLDQLDAVPPGAVRMPLARDGATLGVLEVAGAPPSEPLLRIVADVLTPYLAASELAEDLAFEVAVQSREIEEQRLFTSLIIDSLPVGLHVVDRDYRIQVWNRKRETGTQGLRRDEVVGRPIFEVLTRQRPEELRAEFDRVFESGETLTEEIEVPLGGTRRFFRSTKIPMRLEGGSITHVITIGEDVTEWRTIQGQILQSEKLAAIGQLAAGVMHEINNPLATIGACVAAIEGRLNDSDAAAVGAPVREYLEIIDKEVQRCTAIVDGLLDFSRPKGKAKAPVPVNGIIEEALFLVKHHPRFRQIAIRAELEPGLPEAFGNAEQLIQVIMALLLNAVDAIDGGGSIGVRSGRSPVRTDEVVIEVEDAGVGIPHLDQTKIFEPFYTTKPPGRGTGLGLSICYGILEEHRGRIEVESGPGRGSIFRICLPVGAP